MAQPKGFVSRWLVTIVMIPAIALMHLGWKELQNVDSLVKPEERKDEYPHQALYHLIEDKIKKFRHQPD